MVVGGDGAVGLPVPPVAAVNHERLVPVAVRGVDADPWHSVIGEVTVGGGATFVMVIVTFFVTGQLPVGSAEVTVYVVVTTGVAVTVAPLVPLKPTPPDQP